MGLEEAELTDTYYLEADVDFQDVGKFIGIIAAAEYGDISGGTDGEKSKLAFSYSGGNKIYKCDNGSWDDFETGGYISNLKADPADCKFAILRDGSVYYLLLNDKIAGSITSDKYGDSGFGFCSMSTSGTATFSNVNYTLDPVAVKKLEEYFTTTPSLGGSFNYADGTVVSSFNNTTWTVNSDGASGTISGPSYIFNGGTAGSVYYAEATFSKSPQAWVGILINTLDGAPTNNKGWYGYGIYNATTLYLHTFASSWQEGVSKGSVSTGSGTTFKLGVARIDDYYYVFVNDALVLSERVTAYSTLDNEVALDADNISGFGIFIGSNFNPKNLAYSNFNFTMDRAEIAAKVGSADITYDSSKLSVSQSGKTVASLDKLFSGLPAEISLNVPSGKVVESIQLLLNGSPVSLSMSGGKFTFTPVTGGSYSVEVVYADEGEASLSLTVKPYEIDGYNLYPELTVNPSDVTVTVVDMTTGTESASNLVSLTEEFPLKSGYYLIKVEYGDNVYSYDVFLSDGETETLTGYVSLAYLGLRMLGYTTINFKGLFWMQGESDKGNPTEYEKAFKYFVEDVRDDLGEIAETDLSALPVFVGEISRTSGSADISTVDTNIAFIAMQQGLPDVIDNVYVIASGDYDINQLVGGSNVAVGTDRPFICSINPFTSVLYLTNPIYNIR